MRLTLSLSMLLIAPMVCANDTPSVELKSSLLEGVAGDHYKVDPYIHAAIELQSMGKDAAISKLHSMAQERKFEAQVIVLCRMLFCPRAGADFRGPMLGLPSCVFGTNYKEWPLEPIELVDGVPFLVTRGYSLAGKAESSEKYLSYCESTCIWSDFRYTRKDAKAKAEALDKLLASIQKKTSKMNAHDQQFLSQQIR